MILSYYSKILNKFLTKNIGLSNGFLDALIYLSTDLNDLINDNNIYIFKFNSTNYFCY